MNKKQAIDIFGSVGKMADALDITKQAIYQWSDDLPQFHQDRVNGAAMRLGLEINKKAA